MHDEGWRSVAPPSALPDISPTWGEIMPSPPPSLIAAVARGEPMPELPISPLVGEMSGRTEGGASREP
ncbi:MAG: precorrin-3B synthase, partial [Mesorhizobium sp.]